MIKLELSDKPKKLTPELQHKLTEVFKAKHRAVWHRKFIKEAVFALSSNKCAFSEIKLKEEGKFPEVEHFYPKCLYPDKVVEWGNLMPISSYCNKKKKDVDPNVFPLVNPLTDDPKDYFFISKARIWVKNGSIKAINTLTYLGLNDDLKEVRERVEKKTEDTLGDILAFHCNNGVRCVSRLKALMREGDRKMEYSSTVSTYILQSGVYKQLKLHLQSNKMWDSEFDELEEGLEFCSLPK